MNFRYPNITAGSPAEQIHQLKGFLYNLVEQLNLQEGGSSSPSPAGTARAREGSKAGVVVPAATPGSNFNQIKDLIIKSADIVNAYYDKITAMQTLNGVYVAQAELATFIEETTNGIVADSTCTKQEFTNLQSIVGSLGQWQTDTSASIKSGLLYYEDAEGNELTGVEEGTPVYGIEVGQTSKDAAGNEVFNKFARFTASGVIFYDGYGFPLVYVTNQQTLIKNAKIEGSFARGKYVETILPDGSSVERWVGV
ncbi:MAG: hypothetical protein IKA47_12475 [Oscillospiraceae bacterium]|nr:hypothetical protein [Oscillospiraceae bacterium]